MKWTSDQLEAIENRESNMLVSAAAGSGKNSTADPADYTHYSGRKGWC